MRREQAILILSGLMLEAELWTACESVQRRQAQGPAMPTLHHAGAAIHYTTLGEKTGRTLTLIHGAGGNAMSWWQNAPAFAA